MNAFECAWHTLLHWPMHRSGALLTAVGLCAVIGLIAFLIVLQRREWRRVQKDRIERNRKKRARLSPSEPDPGAGTRGSAP